jgi:hypothetical protein
VAQDFALEPTIEGLFHHSRLHDSNPTQPAARTRAAPNLSAHEKFGGILLSRSSQYGLSEMMAAIVDRVPLGESTQ